MLKLLYKVLGVTKNLKKIDDYRRKEKDELIELFNDGHIFVLVKGQTSADLKDVLASIQDDKYNEAIDKLKLLKTKKIYTNMSQSRDIILEGLDNIQILLENIASKSILVDKFDNGKTFFDNELIINSITSMKGHFAIGKYLITIKNVGDYIRKDLNAGEKVFVQNEDEHVFEKFKVLDKHLKKRFYERLVMPDTILYDKSEMHSYMHHLESQFPLAKKIHDKDKFLADKEKQFLRFYPRYLYSQFYNAVIEKIIKDGNNASIESAIALFIVEVKACEKLNIRNISKVFLEYISFELEQSFHDAHIRKEMHLLLNMAHSHSAKNHSKKNEEASKILLKKEVPERVILFADTLAGYGPAASKNAIKKYIIRIYRNSKPINLNHLIKVFGMQDSCLDYINNMAAKMGLEVMSPMENNAVLTENIDDTNDIKDIISSDANDYTTVQHIDTPQTCGDIIDLLRRSGLVIFNEKQLGKQIQSVLIDSDSDKKMRKKLVFLLEHPSFSWSLKKNKFKALNIALGYRLVAKTIDGKDYVIGVLHHDDYDLLIPEFNNK